MKYTLWLLVLKKLLLKEISRRIFQSKNHTSVKNRFTRECTNIYTNVLSTKIKLQLLSLSLSPPPHSLSLSLSLSLSDFHSPQFYPWTKLFLKCIIIISSSSSSNSSSSSSSSSSINSSSSSCSCSSSSSCCCCKNRVCFLN